MTQAIPKHTPRFTHLDIAKGFAIISVVLLHLSSEKILFATAAPWHIWQAMPIFLTVAGMTSALVFEKNKGNLVSYYKKLPQRMLSLYLPYLFVIIFYYTFVESNLTIDLLVKTMLMGYLGPGGYFVPLIITHLIFFPLMLVLRSKLNSDALFLCIALAVSVFFELAFAFVDVDSSRFFYRIYYFRYLFAACLGAVCLHGNPFAKKLWLPCVCLSILYMYMVGYANGQPSFIRNDSWGFQHYPAYFYTVFLILCLKNFGDKIPFSSIFIALGKISYDIFMAQLFFFIVIYPHFKTSFFADVGSFFICLALGFLLAKTKEFWAKLKQST